MSDLPRYTFLGPVGTFTELALRTIVSPTEAEYVPVIDVPTALAAVRDGEADYAVVAIENTVEGGVTATLDSLGEGAPLVILAETVLAIEFELLVRPGTSVEDITRVSSHSHGWAQVRRWAHATLPNATFVPSSSNTAAALLLADTDLSADQVGFDAALAPPGTGKALGLTVLIDHIADNPNAATRFVSVGRPQVPPAPTGADKTTLVVHLPGDRAGALLEMLEQFAVRGVNLSRIESRPIGNRPGEYAFSIDALAHIDEARMAEALVGLRRTNPVVRYLGSYPAVHRDVTPVAAGTSTDDFASAHQWVDELRAGRHT